MLELQGHYINDDGETCAVGMLGLRWVEPYARYSQTR